MHISDRIWFLGAVVLYGISATYAVFLYRRGFRRDDRINYLLLLLGFLFHSAAMIQRGFSLNRCPISNLYEATIFINWTIVTVYLPLGFWRRLRFLGVVAAPILFGLGVFALMPALDAKEAAPVFSGALSSLHKSLILLGYGAFGLSAVAALMFLMQEHDLKFRKMRAVLSGLPPIQRLERVMSGLVLAGLILLSAGLVVSFIYLKKTHGVYLKADVLLLYCLVVWAFYLMVAIGRWVFHWRGRRLAWGTVAAFAFVMLTFWGIFLLSGLHNPNAPS